MANSTRNSNAGRFTGTSVSSKNFAKNPASRKKKNEYNKKYNSTPEQKKYRAELNRENREKGTYGKMTKMGKDRSHTKDGKIVLEDKSKNRARNGKNGKSTKK
jgi:hypothetical protein